MAFARTSCRSSSSRSKATNLGPLHALWGKLDATKFLHRLGGVGGDVALVGQPTEEPPLREEVSIDRGDCLALFTT